jgi:hypothetical protein
MRLKRWLVIQLDERCPCWQSGPFRGCRMALWSSKLDERWGTEVWKDVAG